jgi:glycosyltransferase involved in cell wall biosynthesis
MTTANSPGVDVVIPAFNAAPFLAEAIDSALRETGVNPSVIVVDDGSTDETPSIVAPYLNRIRYVRQPREGQAAARNRGLRLGQSPYVAFLDADDYYVPGGLASALGTLAARQDLGAVQGGVVEVDASGARLRTLEVWRNVPGFDLETCIRRKPVWLQALLLRREWAERVDGFDVALRWAEDVDFLIRLVAAGCLVEWLRVPIGCYRQHDRSLTSQAVSEAAALEVVLDKYFRRADVPDQLRHQERSIRYYSLTRGAWRMLRSGQTEAIVPQLRRALVSSPYEVGMAALEWQRLFAHWTNEENRPTDELERMWSYIDAVIAETEHVGGSALQRRWWIEVWAPLLRKHHERVAKGLTEFRTLGVEEISRLAQFSLLRTESIEMIGAIEQLWEEVQRAGLVPVASRDAVASLYLTAFGQAQLAGRTRVAWQALRKAMYWTRSRRGVAAWIGFVRAALRHVQRRPAKTRHEA